MDFSFKQNIMWDLGIGAGLLGHVFKSKKVYVIVISLVKYGVL